MEYAQEIELLKKRVLEQFGRTLDAPTDYDLLSVAIEKATGEIISVSTLKRIFGYKGQSTIPRPSTLSVLARYVGTAGWSDFCELTNLNQSDNTHTTAPITKTSYMQYWQYIAAAVLGTFVFIFVWNLYKVNNQPSSEQNVTQEPIIATDSTLDNRQELCRRAILEEALQRSQRMCDRVRKMRNKLPIREYVAEIDKQYVPFLFDTLSKFIKQQCQESFDATTADEYNRQIFSQCQQLCIELYKECSEEHRDVVFATQDSIQL